MNSLMPLCVSMVCCAALPCFAQDAHGKQEIIFATYADDPNEIGNVLTMAESIRAFAGRYKDAPIWVYVPEAVREKVAQVDAAEFARLKVDLKTSDAPEDAAWFYYSGKVFAAGRAEAGAAKLGRILAWLDEDTIVLQEPGEFALPAGKSLGFRPVMHKNVGLFFDEPVDDFWGRVYQKLSVPDSVIFPMITPADGDTIRPYFNAGCLVVRPERGLLGKWGDCFTSLYRDSVLTTMCREDTKKRIFIHQVALVGAILTQLGRSEMVEFSDRVNYPIFFEQQFDSKYRFDDITGVITFRHESYFAKPDREWHKKLKGPADRIAWMMEHLVKKEGQ